MDEVDPLADLDAAIAGAERIVARIRADQWELPTPCDGVDVRAMVNHLVAGNLAFVTLITGTEPPVRDADHLGDDPFFALRASADLLVAALRTPGIAVRTYPLPFGECRAPRWRAFGSPSSSATAGTWPGQPARRRTFPTASPRAVSPRPAASSAAAPPGRRSHPSVRPPTALPPSTGWPPSSAAPSEPRPPATGNARLSCRAVQQVQDRAGQPVVVVPGVVRRRRQAQVADPVEIDRRGLDAPL